jgi:hypothetical protein
VSSYSSIRLHKNYHHSLTDVENHALADCYCGVMASGTQFSAQEGNESTEEPGLSCILKPQAQHPENSKRISFDLPSYTVEYGNKLCLSI